MRLKALVIAAALLAALAANTAIAKEKGDFILRIGGSYIDPTSNNHEVVDVDSASSLTFDISYMMTDNWAVELLAAWPFEHDLYLKGTNVKVGETTHLPPTVSLQYHFMPQSKFQPYVGLGINYTRFFSDTTTGPLQGMTLSLGSSTGWAGQIGADLMMGESWFLNANARYMDIDTDARLNGDDIGSVKIDPWVYGLNVGFTF